MTGDDDLINDLVESARKDHESEKAAQVRAGQWLDAYRTNTLPTDLQGVKDAAIELVATVLDDELLEWGGDLMIRLLPRLGLQLGDIAPSEAEQVVFHVIDDERERRGLPDPDDYIDEDEERWTEAIAELPHDATVEEISDAIRGSDIEHGLYNDDPADE